MRIRKNDIVQVIAGKDKGKSGKVLSTLVDRDRVIIENINMAKDADGVLFIQEAIRKAKVAAPDRLTDYQTYPWQNRREAFHCWIWWHCP